MATSGDPKTGDYFALPLSNVNGPLPPPPNRPSPQIMTWEWLRTLYEVIHEVHTIKLRFHH